MAGEFPDGAWFVELADLRQPDLVISRVAAVLGVSEEPGRPLLETLADVLRRRRLLLALDNCEHLIDVCAQVARQLVAGRARARGAGPGPLPDARHHPGVRGGALGRRRGVGAAPARAPRLHTPDRGAEPGHRDGPGTRPVVGSGRLLPALRRGRRERIPGPGLVPGP